MLSCTCFWALRRASPINSFLHIFWRAKADKPSCFYGNIGARADRSLLNLRVNVRRTYLVALYPPINTSIVDFGELKDTRDSIQNRIRGSRLGVNTFPRHEIRRLVSTVRAWSQDAAFWSKTLHYISDVDILKVVFLLTDHHFILQ